MTLALDRRAVLQSSITILGIDYLLVDNAHQTDLDVHFLRPPSAAEQARLTPDLVTIRAAHGDAPPVAVRAVTFPTVGSETVLRVQAAQPGTFTTYILQIAPPPGAPLLDPYLASIEFSFKAGCYTDVDCAAEIATCPPELLVDAPIDYHARDFWSFRSALFDFASQRYPRWADRLEADAAVMLIEVMSALGDELAYHQDRVGREAHLETASQRRSLRRHARLVDYEVHDGLGATTWIDVTAKRKGSLPAGTRFRALRDEVSIEYSVGRNLDEMLRREPYEMDPARNEFTPYAWDASEACLPVGAMEMSLQGDRTAALGQPGRWILLRTDPADPGQPARRHLVRLTKVEKVTDPLANVDTTRIVWEAEQALPFEMDLAALHVRGNLVPAVAGALVERDFVIGPGTGALPAADEKLPWAVERLGPNGSVTFLFSLDGTATDGLVYRARDGAPADAHGATPELRLALRTVLPDGTSDDEAWEWRRSFLAAPASLAFDTHVTLDDGTWQRVVGYQRPGGEFVHVDYADDAGATIRFGDGVFGRVPDRGSRFHVSYLVGNGRRANLPAGAITRFDQVEDADDQLVKGLLSGIENPFAITDGVDPETAEEIRQLAPEAFRAVAYRAVRPEDYAEAAERLTWVQRAGCSFRWTGSWQTAFVTPDPRSSVELSPAERVELERQLDRFRQAGRETHALEPTYADLDLRITFCVAPDAYPAEVKTRVVAALSGSRTAFFSADNFTFGKTLERTRLEAAIQAVEGVRAVETITFRRRGFFDWQTLPSAAFRPGRNEVIRVENDSLHPDRGSIQLIAEGGA
jgi:hypothetical protein